VRTLFTHVAFPHSQLLHHRSYRSREDHPLGSAAGVTGTIQKREQQDQLLDAMDLERERGITIKMHPVAMTTKRKTGTFIN
jgi:hypothetical protein